MADKIKNSETSTTAEQAMNDVLKAEHQAKQNVEQCKSEAELLLQQTRQQAQRIAERADNRITRIHQRCSRAITDQVKTMKIAQEKNVRESGQSAPNFDMVNAVAEEIAKRLTTPNPEKQKNNG